MGERGAGRAEKGVRKPIASRSKSGKGQCESGGHRGPVKEEREGKKGPFSLLPSMAKKGEPTAECDNLNKKRSQNNMIE